MGQEFGTAISFLGVWQALGHFSLQGLGEQGNMKTQTLLVRLLLAQVNRFGSRSSNKLCVILRFVSDCRKKHNAGRWQKTRL